VLQNAFISVQKLGYF